MKYDHYDDYLNQTKEHFTLLKSFVLAGNIEQIDVWFSKHFDYQDEQENGYLSQLIRNTTHFYAQKKSDYNSPPTINLKTIEEEGKKRHLAIIKHFPPREQLSLIHDLLLIENHQMDEDYFSLINYTGENKEKGFLLHSSWVKIIAECFFQEQFNLIDYIEHRFQHDFLNQADKSIALHYDEDTFHGVTFASDQNAFFKAYFDIMLYYSETKKAYLKEKGIELPNHHDAVFLQNKIMARHDYPREGMVKLVGNLKAYQAKLRYDNLNNQIEAEYGDNQVDNEYHTSSAKLKI